MTKFYKTVAEDAYLHAFYDENVRPDGRAFTEFRNLRVQKNILDHVDSSCLISLGSTITLCAIVVEATDDKPGDTLEDYINLKTELPHITRQHLRTSQCIHLSTTFSQSLFSILNSTECIDLKEFYDDETKCYRKLSIELVLMNDDGCVLDALSLALCIALHHVQFPKTTRDEQTGELSINRDKEKHKNKIMKDALVTFSFAILNGKKIISDTTACEEKVLTSRVVVVASFLKHTLFPLHTRGASLDHVKECHKLCKERLQDIMYIIME